MFYVKLYFLRFKQEEIKIMAWENHQKATIEAELRKIEVYYGFLQCWNHSFLYIIESCSRDPFCWMFDED